jgi:hypothetical protein
MVNRWTRKTGRRDITFLLPFWCVGRRKFPLRTSCCNCQPWIFFKRQYTADFFIKILVDLLQYLFVCWISFKKIIFKVLTLLYCISCNIFLTFDLISICLFFLYNILSHPAFITSDLTVCPFISYFPFGSIYNIFLSISCPI